MLQKNLIPGVYLKFPLVMWSQNLVWWWATNAASSQQPLVDPAVIRAWWGLLLWSGLASLVRWLIQRLSGPWDNNFTCQPMTWRGTVTVRDTEKEAMDVVGMHKAGQEAGMLVGCHLPAPRNLHCWDSQSQGGVFVFNKMLSMGFSSVNLMLHEKTCRKRKYLSNKSQNNKKKY